MPSPAELRRQFLELRASGAPLPKPAAGRPAPPPQRAREVLEVTRDQGPEVELASIAAGVAKLLGWEHRSAEEEHRGETLARGDGPSFRLHRQWGDKARLAVSGDWPKAEDGTRFSARRRDYGGTHQEITVAASRTAESIAADIERRFLPGYLEEWGHQEKQRDEHEENRRYVEDLADSLARIIGTNGRRQYQHDTRGNRSHFSRGEYGDGAGWHLDGEVSAYYRQEHGRTVKLELSCNEETARAVLALLAEAT